MAINDISLTAGMRSNLLSLQGTVDLLNRTQSRLSSGKKVNSAIDNPVSFFASQSLTSRASKIDSLKDAMGQAVQTITAADKGITAITSMIEQAKGIAQQALSAPASTGFDTETVTMNTVALGDSITIEGTALTAGPTAVVTSTSYDDFTMTLTGVDAGDTVSVGGVTFTGTAGSTTTVYDSVDVELTNIAAGDEIIVGGVTYTASTGAGGTDFDVSGGAAAGATSLAARIAAHQGGAYGAMAGGTVVNITAGTSPLAAGTVTENAVDPAVTVTENTHEAANALDATEFLIGTDNATATNLRGAVAAYFGGGLNAAVLNNVVTITAGTMDLSATTVQAGTADPATEIVIVSNTTVTTAAGALGADEFAVSGDNVIDAQALANLINNNATITGAGYAATASNGVLSLSKTGADITAANVTVSDPATMVEATVEADSELLNLQNQYNELRNQISAVANDSGYKGKNLLSADANLNTLVVQFEGNTLTVQGEDMTTTGLGMTQAAWTAGGTTAISADLTRLDAALDKLAQNSSNLSGNLSVITVRQDFSTQMINTLTEGSDKLTLADANQEGANMLMLQTRQSLSTTALSLSAQAAQSVLRLFQ